MQVKKFEAPTMQEALKTIKRELGPDAIILSTKHIKSGFGLMSKASVEVTAAVADKDLKKKNAAEKNLPNDVKEKIWGSKAEKQAEIYDDYFEKQLRRAGKERVQLTRKTPNQVQEQQARQNAQQEQQKNRQQLANARAQTAAQQFARPPAQEQTVTARAPAPTKVAERERRYVDIEDDDAPARRPSAPPARAQAGQSPDKVRSLEADIEQLKSMIGELASGATSRERDRDEAEQDLSEALVKTMQDLVGAGVEKRLARQLVRNAAFDLGNDQRNDEQAVLDKVAGQLISEIKTADLLAGVGAAAGNSASTVVALVGPTGVGKTTTIAKIASLGILEKRLRVGLINLDSYKVAAADQLSTYAKIMNVPFRSVNTREELSQAIYDFSSLDLVLIDTTGRSQKDQESLLQLRHMLAAVEGVKTVLLVSATTKDSDINEVTSRFRIFSPIGLVFSKLDETSVYGCIYNVQKRCTLPLLYFTVGQRVPEDIERASAERVVDLVLDL